MGSLQFIDWNSDSVISYGEPLANEMKRMRKEQERISNTLHIVMKRLDSFTTLLTRNVEDSKTQRKETVNIINNHGRIQTEEVRETIGTIMAYEMDGIADQIAQNKKK